MPASKTTLATPCCSDMSMVYLLAVAFIVGLFVYLHKPHRPKEFALGAPNTHYEKLLERIRGAKRSASRSASTFASHFSRASSTEGFSEGPKGSTKGATKEKEKGKKGATEGKKGATEGATKEKEKGKKDATKSDGAETDDDDDDDTAEGGGTFAREGTEGAAKKKAMTAKEWAEVGRPTFDVQNDPFNAQYMRIYDKLTFTQAKFDYETALVEKHIQKARIFSGVSVLDVGCGTGRHVAHMRNRGYEAIGLDKSPNAVEHCKKLHPSKSKHFIQGDALLSTQFKDRAFTHILCLNNTLYYLDDHGVFFRNCSIWMKPDGLLFLHLVDDIEQRYYDTSGWVRLKDGTKYKSTYDVLGDKTLVDEKIKDADGNVLLNKHVMHHVGKTERILKAAQRHGLDVVRKYPLKKVGFKHHYLYVLQR